MFVGLILQRFTGHFSNFGFVYKAMSFTGYSSECCKGSGATLRVALKGLGQAFRLQRLGSLGFVLLFSRLLPGARPKKPQARQTSPNVPEIVSSRGY